MPVAINSASELDAQLKGAGDKMVVIDFHATWCGPCHAIAPTYERLSAQYAAQGLFLKVDVDAVPAVAQRYAVRAMPTFLFLRRGQVLDTLKGADPGRLASLCAKHASGSSGSGGAAFSGKGQTIGGGASSSGSGSSAATPSGSSGSGGGLANQRSLLPLIDAQRSTCLNQSSVHALAPLLRGASGGTYLASDADEQLLVHLAFAQKVRVAGLLLRTTHSEAHRCAPRRIRLFVNRPTLGFDDAEAEQGAQELELALEDVRSGEHGGGGRVVQLKFVKFQNVDSIAIAILSNQGDEDVTRIDAIDIFGTPVDTTNMADLKKLEAEGRPRSYDADAPPPSRTGLKGGSGGGAGGGNGRYYTAGTGGQPGYYSSGPASNTRSRDGPGGGNSYPAVSSAGMAPSRSAGAASDRSSSSSSATTEQSHASSAYTQQGQQGQQFLHPQQQSSSSQRGHHRRRSSTSTSRTSVPSFPEDAEELEDEPVLKPVNPATGTGNGTSASASGSGSARRASHERKHSYSAREHSPSSRPFAPPRFTPRDEEEFEAEAAAHETSSFAGWHFAPLAVALAPPLGAVLGGKAEHWSNAILLFLCSFWLYQFLRVPWDIYFVARTRRVLATDRVEEELANESPERKSARLAAKSELQRAEVVALLWCVASPLVGAYLLSWLRETLTDGAHYLNTFNIRLFVLAAGMKPWVHLFRLLRKRLLLLQEDVHYPSAQVEQMAKRMRQIESELSTLRKLFATKNDVRLLRDGIDMPLSQLSRAVRRYEKKEEHLRLSAEDKFALVESRLEDLLREVAINAELIEAERRERERVANLPMSLFQAIRYALGQRSASHQQPRHYLHDAPRSFPTSRSLGAAPMGESVTTPTGSGMPPLGLHKPTSPQHAHPPALDAFQQQQQQQLVSHPIAGSTSFVNGSGYGTTAQWYERGTLYYLFLPLNLTTAALRFAGDKARHISEDAYYQQAQAQQQQNTFAAQQVYKRLDHAR